MFALLHHEIAAFQGWSKLACKAGCGKCCTKPDIEATVLEFIPLAHHLYITNQCFEWLERLKNTESSVCVIFESPAPGSGRCSAYPYRGLICRLFGFSARINKHAQKELVTCQVIKSEQALPYAEVLEKVGHDALIPVMSHYYMRMLAIDSDLARNFYPINEAIKRAIETVLHHYAYRDQEV